MTDPTTTVTESDRRAPSRWYRLGAVTVLALGAAAVIGSRTLGVGSFASPEAGLWPLLVAAVLFLCGVVLLVVDDANDYEAWGRPALRPVLALATLVGFVIVFQTGLFLFAAAAMLVVWLRLIAHERWPLTIALAVAGPIILHLVFQTWLGVRLSDGLIPQEWFAWTP